MSNIDALSEQCDFGKPNTENLKPFAPSLDEILDSVFHGCAFKAFVEVAHEMQGPPCPIRTRQRAYKLYEESLAEKNGTARLTEKSRSVGVNANAARLLTSAL